MARDRDRDIIDKFNSTLVEEIGLAIRKELAPQIKPLYELYSKIVVEQRLLRDSIVALQKEEQVYGKIIKEFQKELKILTRKVKKIHDTLDVAIRTFDSGDVRLHKRVDRIEAHLGLGRIG